MLEKERDEYIEEIYELTKRNNKLLRKIYRGQILSRVGRIIWLLIIIGVPAWLYFYYLKPLIGGLQDNLVNLENLAKVNPVIGKQIEPIIQTIKTIMGLFGIN